MDIKEQAKIFAINAHRNQVRKNEPDKPMIIHPISVGNMLESYGYDDEVVAAGYLHDVVEDTKYTIEDIEKNFGKKVANLVFTASEPDKTKSWEERKQHTIDTTKTLPLENKLIICADKINNLEDIMIKFQKYEKRDFSLFKRGEEKQKWYYENIYESLIYNENKELPIFKRLKRVIDIVFHNSEDKYLKDIIFKDNQEYYKKLKKLHAQKQELQRLKEISPLTKPFVIEFCGTPRTGKTSSILNLYDFFKKGGFMVAIIEEFTTSKYYKEKIRTKKNNEDIQNLNLDIIENIEKQLKKSINSNNEIILIDRSLNDRQIWNYNCFKDKNMDEKTYIETKEKYANISKKLIDFLVITYTDSMTSLRRDYASSLALENRTFLNKENIDKYNNSLNTIKEEIDSNVENYIFLDTTNMTYMDSSINIAENIMNAMRKKYVDNIYKYLEAFYK